MNLTVVQSRLLFTNKLQRQDSRAIWRRAIELARVAAFSQMVCLIANIMCL